MKKCETFLFGQNLKLKKTRHEKFDSSGAMGARGSKRQQGSLLVNDDQVNIDLEPHQGAMMPLLQSQQQLAYDQTVSMGMDKK